MLTITTYVYVHNESNALPTVESHAPTRYIMYCRASEGDSEYAHIDMTHTQRDSDSLTDFTATVHWAASSSSSSWAMTTLCLCTSAGDCECSAKSKVKSCVPLFTTSSTLSTDAIRSSLRKHEFKKLILNRDFRKQNLEIVKKNIVHLYYFWNSWQNDGYNIWNDFLNEVLVFI